MFKKKYIYIFSEIMLTLYLYIFISFFVYAKGVELPPGVEICSKSDPNLGECMEKSMETCLRAFKNGYKELGIPQVEPYYIESMNFGKSEGSVSIEQTYKNIHYSGLTTSKISEVKMDMDKCEWSFLGISPEIRMEADYSMKGQLLLFPINGHGRCNVSLYDIHTLHTLKCERVTKKDGVHLKVTGFTMDIVPTNVKYEFDNLLPGNEQISKELSNTINENGLKVFNDVKKGFEEVFSQIYTNAANAVFSRMPENELFKD